MFQATTQIRIRYGETDRMGYAYYGYYMFYYEVARTDALRTVGMTYKAMEDKGIILPVADIKSKYIKPVHYDELITIKTYIREMPGIRVKFDYDVFNEKGELVNTGETTLVFIDKAKRKPCSPPEEFIEKMSDYF